MDSPLGLVQPIDPKGLTAEIGGNFVWNFGEDSAGLRGRRLVGADAMKAHGEAATDRQRVWSGNYEHSWHAPTPRLAPEAHRLDASERPGAGPRPD